MYSKTQHYTHLASSLLLSQRPSRFSWCLLWNWNLHHQSLGIDFVAQEQLS